MIICPRCGEPCTIMFDPERTLKYHYFYKHAGVADEVGAAEIKAACR